MLKDKVLDILINGKGYVSGQAISNSLDITRSAVWKEINKLRKEGYIIDSVTNKGYKIVNEPDVLNVPEIKKHTSSKTIASELEVYQQLDSTNTYLKNISHTGINDGYAVIADELTKGKGRNGRSFSAAKGKGVWTSVFLRPKIDIEQISVITVYTAVAVCNALERLCGKRPQIKWTNDIIMGNKKVCGILTEASVQTDTLTLDYVILGIGVNLTQDESDFPEDVQNVATSVKMQTGKTFSRSACAAAIYNELDKMYRDGHFVADKAEIIRQYKNDICILGKKVRVIKNGEEKILTAKDIGDDGQLVVEDENGKVYMINSGEVSVRGMYGYVQ